MSLHYGFSPRHLHSPSSLTQLHSPHGCLAPLCHWLPHSSGQLASAICWYIWCHPLVTGLPTRLSQFASVMLGAPSGHLLSYSSGSPCLPHLLSPFMIPANSPLKSLPAQNLTESPFFPFSASSSKLQGSGPLPTTFGIHRDSVNLK